MLNNLIILTIYILALEDNKYYITKLPSESNKIIESYISNKNISDLHSFFGNGAHWLSLYPIIKIDSIIEENVKCDNIVKDYMAIHGAHNVRGCSFTDVAFQENDFKNLVKELNTKYERVNLEEIMEDENDENIVYSTDKIRQCFQDDVNKITTCN